MANLVGTMVYPDGTAFTGTLTLRLNGPAKDGSNNLVMPAYQNFAIGTTGVVDITIGDTDSLTSIDSTQVFYEMILDDDDNPVKIGHLKVGTGTTSLADAWANTFSEPHASLIAYIPFNNMPNKYPRRAGNDIGTFSSAMSYNSSGKLGQCIPITGHTHGTSGDVVMYLSGSSFGGNRSANLCTTQGAISFWINPLWDGNDSREHVLLDTTSPSPIKIAKISDNTLSVVAHGESITTDVSSWKAGTYHHIAFIWDRNNTLPSSSNHFELYVDNVLAQGNTTLFSPSGVGNLYIGCNINGGSQARGDLDDLAIFDRFLTTTEIADIYNSGTGAEAGILASAEMLSYLKFDGSGNLTSGTNAGMGCSFPWAANLVADGDMETAGTASWTPAFSTLTKMADNFRDTRTLRCVASSGGVTGDAFQTIAVGSSSNYFLSVWGKTAYTNPMSFLGAVAIGAGESSFTRYEMAIQATAAVTGTVTLSGELGGTGYFDNLWVGTALLNNGGFEGAWTNGTIPAGWTRVGGCVGTQVTSGMHGGAAHLRVQAGDNSGTHYQQQLTNLTNNKWYAFVGYLLAGAGTCNINLSAAATTTLTGTQTSWTRKSHVFKATEGTLNVRLYANSGGTANFDDITLIQLNDIDVTVTPAALGSSYDDGKWGTALGALRINGGDTFTLPGTTAIGSNISYGTGAVSLWFKSEGWHGSDSVSHMLIDIPDSDDNTNINRIFIQKTGTNQLEFNCYGSTANGYKAIDVAVGTANLGSNAWHHILASWTAAGPDSLWLNGTSVGTAKSGGVWSNMNATPGNLRIGSNIASVSQVVGLIDEVRIYDKIPSTANKTAIYDDEEYLGQS